MGFCLKVVDSNVSLYGYFISIYDEMQNLLTADMQEAGSYLPALFAWIPSSDRNRILIGRKQLSRALFIQKPVRWLIRIL